MDDCTPYAPIRSVEHLCYLHYQLYDFPTVDEYRHVLIQIANAGTQSYLSRVLLDASTVQSSFEVMEARAFGHTLGAVMPRHFRLALLVHHYSPGRHRAEAIALSHLVYLKYFTKPDEALKWLLKGASRP